jgi:hypothetical protein
MLPARLDPNALAGAVARLSGNGPHRRTVERHGEIDGSRIGGGDRLDRDAGDEAGGDQRAAKVVDQRRLISLARLEARDGLDVLGPEQRPAFDEDAPELARAPGVDRQHQGGGARRVIDGDVQLADVRECVAAAAELDSQRRLAGGDPLRIDRIVGSDAERSPDRRRVDAGFVQPFKPDLRETV